MFVGGAVSWLSFLRQYGPIARNDNMYDETIRRVARRLKLLPIVFEHPMENRVVQCFDRSTADPVSVILTGTAGDGKTHLCSQVWTMLGGEESDWASDSPYLSVETQFPTGRTKGLESADPGSYRPVRVHFIRDLSAWAPQHGSDWDPKKDQLLQKFCRSLFDCDTEDIFLIAANDGTLIESWRRLRQSEDVQRAAKIFEDLLVEDRQDRPGVRLKFFNLSRCSSADLFERAIEAFLGHPGWEELRSGTRGENEVFGPKCPIRHNYELLQTPLIRLRLASLLELCDHNGLHVPIRQILILLTNSVLGHPDVKDDLMVATDVPKVIAAQTVSRASLYNNLFGGNLSEIRRQTITIFEYLDRFRIGHETSNRVDNLLIFGEGDEHLGRYFDEFIANDKFYGADARFYAAKQEYIEGTNEAEDKSSEFLELLVAQRRGLFFKIPKESESALCLWELTVFKFAGEYLENVVNVLKDGNTVKRPILSRLVKGLNRVFTGMLINSERELYLATSGNDSQAKVSRILIEHISVEPSKGEKVSLRFDDSTARILLSVFFSPTICEDFPLTLIRYEFLSRIALEGALPASFSKECYEDLLAFKSRLIAAQLRRHSQDPPMASSAIGINFLTLTDQGTPDPRFVEIAP
jgi:hypothetical protein